MDQLEGLSTGRQLILAAAVLLLIDTFIAWQKHSADAAGTYVGVVLGALVPYGAWITFQESGESLPQRSSAPDGGA